MEPTPNSASIGKAYEGLGVLDLSQGIAGPYCAQIMHQLGADVIKIEPLEGDWSRSMGMSRDGMSALSMAFNRGKKSVVCNARMAGGRDIIRALAARADVIVQSFRPGVAARLGAGYTEVALSNPRVVYVSISGFGLDGPYVERPATDAVAQAVAGLAMANSDTSGMPATAKPYVADVSCGLYAAQAVSAALFMRERTGHGAHLDVSLLASLAALQNASIIDHVWRAGVSTTAATTPQGIFATADGHIVLAALNDAMFAAICNVVGREDWRSDARLQTPGGRLAASSEITAGVRTALSKQPSDFWLARFADADVLAARVNNYEEFMCDPQVHHLGLLQSTNYPNAPGALPYASLPGLERGPSSNELAPVLGEHTREVLKALGYDSARVADLERTRVVLCQP